MALMKLTRLPTESELDRQSMDFEGFYQAFISKTVEPFTAKVETRGNKVDLGGYSISMADWFIVVNQ